MKKIPMRMCVACRQMKPKRELLRVVRTEEGTASIDRHGHVIYLRDISRQTKRLLENIGALLKDGGATMHDIQYFIVYLRDTSDYEQVETYMQQNYPDIPHVIVHGKVCRPEWLVEMECIAQQ